MKPSRLADLDSPLVLDTSAAINIVASGFARPIIDALPNRMVVVDVVRGELESGRSKGAAHATLSYELISDGTIELVEIDHEVASHFERLVIGNARETLDDGEAATIAYAAEYLGVPVIDERKANRICRERYPGLEVGSTVDMFAHPNLLPVLGPVKLRQAVLNALHLAHMRVLPRHYEWIIDLVGLEDIKGCMSLPASVRRGMVNVANR